MGAAAVEALVAAMVAVVGTRDGLEAATVAVVIATLVEIGPEEVGEAIVFQVGIELEADVFDEVIGGLGALPRMPSPLWTS